MTGLAGRVARATRPSGLVTEIPAGRSLGWWGMMLFIATEATFFGVLLGSYFYVRFEYTGPWPQPPAGVPGLPRALAMTGLILASLEPMVLAQRAVRRGRPLLAVWSSLALTIGLGTAYLAVQGLELAASMRSFTPDSNVYGSLFYLIHGLDGVHVAIGLLITGWLFVAALRGSFGPHHHEQIGLASLYWYFVAIVWLGILFTLYFVPRI